MFFRLNLGQNIKDGKEFDVNDLNDLIMKPENSTKSLAKFMNKTDVRKNNEIF